MIQSSSIGLKLYFFRGAIYPNTPMRQLIEKFPDMAMKVFDKCVTRYGHFMIYLSFNKKDCKQ